MTGIEAIAGLFAGPGARDYLGEAVTIGEHMRQAGALAEAAGAPAPLLAAALLHDVGPHPGPAGRPDDAGAGRRVRRAALCGRRAGGALLGRRGQGPAVTPPEFVHFRPLLERLRQA